MHLIGGQQQAIAWTNDENNLWYYTSLGFNELWNVSKRELAQSDEMFISNWMTCHDIHRWGLSRTWQYTVRPIKYTILLCFVLLWLYHHSQWIHVIYLPVFFRVTSLALGQSYDCPSASKVTLKDMDKIFEHSTSPQQNTPKHKQHSYFMGYTVILLTIYLEQGNHIAKP